MVKVLVVEDSSVARELLVHILSSDPGVKVIGAVADGESVLEFVGRRKPDVITMDINLPGLDGFETTRRIMESDPVPVVVISAHVNTKEVSSSFRAVEAGALMVLEKPVGIAHPDYKKKAGEIVRKVKLMAGVKVIKRLARCGKSRAAVPSGELGEVVPFHDGRIRLVAIGGSTGAPTVFKTIFSALPRDFPVPVVAVQHIAAGFIDGMVKWLGESSAIPVSVARQGGPLLPGRAYLAPDGLQMGVSRKEEVVLRDDPPEHKLRPSVSHLFRSVAQAYGRSAAGVLLSGMGKDGSEELKSMKDRGAVTIVQDKGSSVVYGMPGAAVTLGGATHVLRPEEIPAALAKLVMR